MEISKQKIGRRKSITKPIKFGAEIVVEKKKTGVNFLQEAQSRFENEMGKVGKRKDIMENRLCERARRCM